MSDYEKKGFFVARYVEGNMSRDFKPMVFDDEEEARVYRNDMNKIKSFGVFKVTECGVWHSSFETPDVQGGEDASK